MAMIEVTIPGPATAASMIAESTAGNAKVKSAHPHDEFFGPALRAEAISPRRYPEGKADPDRDDADDDGVSGAPTSSNETMSRPSTSVPSQCAADGGCSLRRHVDLIGDHGVHTSDSKAATSTHQAERAADDKTAMAQRAAPEARTQAADSGGRGPIRLSCSAGAHSIAVP